MVRGVNIQKHLHFSRKVFSKTCIPWKMEKTAETISLQLLVITFSHVYQAANKTSCVNWFKVIEGRGKEREMYIDIKIQNNHKILHFFRKPN